MKQNEEGPPQPLCPRGAGGLFLLTIGGLGIGATTSAAESPGGRPLAQSRGTKQHRPGPELEI